METNTAPAENVDTPAAPPDTLADALARYKIELTPKQAVLVEKYARSLWEWNEKINLTRHTDFEKFVGRDLVDTIELAKLLHAEEEVLDVGSGGGVPGLLLAILRPDLTMHLCDSVQKKMKVVEAIARNLHLNVTVFSTRAEEQLKETRYDAVVSRAVGPLDKILTWFRPHWAYIGRLLLVKGPKWTEEHNEAKRVGLMKKLELRVASEYPLPGTESKSVILKIWHQGARER